MTQRFRLRKIGFGGCAGIAIFCEHLLFGANRTDLALASASIHALFLLGLLATGWGSCGFKAISRSLIVPVLLFGLCLLVLILAMTHSVIDLSAHFIGLIELCGLACLFAAGAILGFDRLRSRQTLKTIVILGFLFCILSLILHVHSPGMTSDFAAGRLTATFVSPNTAATLFGMLAILAMMGIQQGQRERLRQSPSPSQAMELLLRKAPVETATVILACTCLMLTGSRAALGALSVSLVALLLGNIWRSWRTAVLLALLLVLLAGAGSQLLTRRLMSVDSDLSWRVALIGAHWHAFLAKPLLGYGLGSFASVNAMVMTPANMSQLVLMGAVHNVYLQWLEQAGLLGAIPLFCCISWVIGTIAWRRLRGFTALCLFVALHGLTDYGLEVPSIAAMWTFLLGLGYGLAQFRRAASIESPFLSRGAERSRPRPLHRRGRAEIGRAAFAARN